MHEVRGGGGWFKGRVGGGGGWPSRVGGWGRRLGWLSREGGRGGGGLPELIDSREGGRRGGGLPELIDNLIEKFQSIYSYIRRQSV